MVDRMKVETNNYLLYIVKMYAPVSMYKLYNLLVRHTSLLSAYSSVRRIVLSRMTHTLLGVCTLQRSIVSGYTGN